MWSNSRERMEERDGFKQKNHKNGIPKSKNKMKTRESSMISTYVCVPNRVGCTGKQMHSSRQSHTRNLFLQSFHR